MMLGWAQSSRLPSLTKISNANSKFEGFPELLSGLIIFWKDSELAESW